MPSQVESGLSKVQGGQDSEARSIHSTQEHMIGTCSTLTDTYQCHYSIVRGAQIAGLWMIAFWNLGKKDCERSSYRDVICICRTATTFRLRVQRGYCVVEVSDATNPCLMRIWTLEFGREGRHIGKQYIRQM